MKKKDVLKQIEAVGVVPVLRARNSEEAIEIADLIREGGIPILEITMTVPGAVGVIEKLAQRYGDEVLIGAGTVLDSETARACMLAGARFIVSPALDVGTIELCRRYSVASLRRGARKQRHGDDTSDGPHDCPLCPLQPTAAFFRSGFGGI